MIATQIRLRDVQFKSLIVDLIFDCDLHATSWIKLQAQKNVPFNALVIAKSLDISMAIDPIDRSTWNIILDARRKQVIFVREPLANSDAWLIGKVNKIHHHEQGISVSYRSGYNDNGTIGWPDNGRVISAHCCKRAILDRVSNSRDWSFPSEWLSSTHHLDTLIPRDRAPTSAPSP
ncbi:unnamed protein product [Rhizophagus irregularis]|nr:unnamed protein product [Rhizophagus irregularis]